VCNGCGSQWDNRQTAPVVSLLPNLFGLYHITGNVWEWVADPWHNNYEGAPNNGHVWEKEGVRCRRVSRGGGWQSEPKNVRLAYRNGSMNLGDSLDFRSASRGFRLARQEKPLTKTEVEAKQKQPDEIKLQPCQFRVFRHRLKDGSEGPEMVQLPAGTFQMGDIQGNDDEKPVHEVSVARFAMGRYEVTFAEYDKFAEATGRKNPPDENWGRGNLPVINISWHDAVAYAEWLSKQTGQDYRLPTEAQWEYAARAGTETTYWWGNNISNQASCKQCGNFKSTVSVGSFGANPFKLYDTVGNVWEWTCSEYEKSYSGKESQNISPNEGNDSIEIVIRGGSWFDGRWRVRAAIRSKLKPNIRLKTVGFRLVRM
jgi:formylglycine-generating enzyme required for sulfatase activity